MDFKVRWNSYYLMLDRFVTYQSVIENLTVLHRSLIPGLSSAVVSHLKKLIFADDDWDHLIATRNVLMILYRACRILSGRHYQTMSVGYIVSCGLRHVLSQPSSGRHALIEDTIKKYLSAAYLHHFDRKLSDDQKHAMLVRKRWRWSLSVLFPRNECLWVFKISTNAEKRRRLKPTVVKTEFSVNSVLESLFIIHHGSSECHRE